MSDEFCEVCPVLCLAVRPLLGQGTGQLTVDLQHSARQCQHCPPPLPPVQSSGSVSGEGLGSWSASGLPSWCPASSCIVKQPAPSTRVEASQPRECDLQGAAGRSSGGRALRTRLPLLGPELRAVGAAHTEATGRPDSGPAVFSDGHSPDCSESVNSQSFGKVGPVSLWLTGPSSAVGGAAPCPRGPPACGRPWCAWRFSVGKGSAPRCGQQSYGRCACTCVFSHASLLIHVSSHT